jgi:hypothetical protein
LKKAKAKAKGTETKSNMMRNRKTPKIEKLNIKKRQLIDRDYCLV